MPPEPDSTPAATRGFSQVTGSFKKIIIILLCIFSSYFRGRSALLLVDQLTKYTLQVFSRHMSNLEFQGFQRHSELNIILMDKLLKIRELCHKMRGLYCPPLIPAGIRRNPGNSWNSGGIKFGRGACQIDQVIPTEFRTEFKFRRNGSWNHPEGMNSGNSTERNPVPLCSTTNTYNAQPRPNRSSVFADDQFGRGQQPPTLLSHNHHHPQRPPTVAASSPSPTPTTTPNRHLSHTTTTARPNIARRRRTPRHRSRTMRPRHVTE